MDKVNRQKEHTTTQERNQARREKLAGYFYDLSKVIFAGLVIGGITPLFGDDKSNINWITVALGSFVTYIFAFLANRILKQ
jgi:uncharacterized membrane protein YjjP (DUF1212 family)